MNWKKRTRNCGQLRIDNEKENVVLNGWASVVRDLGGLIFIDLRDRWGITQLVAEPEINPELAERAKHVKTEDVVWASGQVRKRENPNMRIPTGLIEIVLDDFGIINKAALPPFEICDDVELNEDTRLKYRFLDLRRPKMQKILLTRNKFYQITHRYFAENDFVEIETPFLMKSTPEGARDFLVPSRTYKGKFYALPQSPQIYKQILMTAGFERYVQIVKCFRDEDLRSDRQAEFTQIDVEMSFVTQEDVMAIAEGYLKKLWKEILDVDIQLPLRKMSYREAMERYGSDKPDLRFDMELKNVTDIIKNSSFKVFSDVADNGGVVAVLNAKGCAADYSRKKIDELTEYAKKYGAKGLAWMKYIDGAINSPIAKFFSQEEINIILQQVNAENGDLLLFGADKFNECYTVLGALRLKIAKDTGIIDQVKDSFEFTCVTDFPLFEFDEQENRFVAMHHPFTSPQDDSLEKIETQPAEALAKAYDIVVNGAEIGGGSIRIHDAEVQRKMFKALGLAEDEVAMKFGFLLEALKYGAPPHGGIAFGLDRMVMILAGTDNIRDTIAFPKTTTGLSLMDGSPSEVEAKQLDELGLSLLKKQ